MIAPTAVPIKPKVIVKKVENDTSSVLKVIDCAAKSVGTPSTKPTPAPMSAPSASALRFRTLIF